MIFSCAILIFSRFLIYLNFVWREEFITLFMHHYTSHERVEYTGFQKHRYYIPRNDGLFYHLINLYA